MGGISTLSAVNGSLDLLCALFCAMIFLYWIVAGKFSSKANVKFGKILATLTGMVLIMNVADAGTWFFLNHPTGMWFILSLIVDYMAINFVLALMHLYLVENLGTVVKFPWFFKFAGFPLAVVMSLLWITSLWTGFIYKIGPLGYIYSDYYWVSQIFMILVFVMDSIIIIFNAQKMDKNQTSCFCLYIILGMAGELLEINTRIVGLYISITMIVFIIHVYNSVLVAGRAKEQEDIIDEEQALLQLSQIKPHFIYNCLNVIQHLCSTNPELAQSATNGFSKFLRGYIDAMDNVAMVPLEDEMYIVENYLYMEKLRFGERLKMEMEILDEDFFVPSLSVEPFIENAIKYGLMQKPEGGTVRIRTYSTYEEHVIEIEDDGVGFNLNSLDNCDGENIRSHIGIKNVKSRLDKLCKGRVEIDSKLGQGTLVKICIPSIS